MAYTQQRGQQTEALALAYLEQQGLALITRNYLCKRGEIDLIMAHSSPIAKRILVCVEVRYRRSKQFGGAAASVTRTKQLRLKRTISHFVLMNRRYASWPIRFDIVGLQGLPDKIEITWLPGAFEC